MSDIIARKYFENMPYGKEAKSSEIHGKQNQQVINGMVTGLVAKYDEAMAIGDKSSASNYDGVVKSIAKDLDSLKLLKQQFATYYGGGTGGKKLFSNYTNITEFDVPFFLEKGSIAFDDKLKPILSVGAPDGKSMITKRISDITQDWVVKGSEESDFMKMQQDAVKQSNTMGEPLDFDVDWQVDNLLANKDAWKSFVSDKVGGRYFLQDYVMENQDKIQSGEIPDEMLHPQSFNPESDTRLHKHYADRIRNAFKNKKYEQKTEKPEEKKQKTNSGSNFLKQLDADILSNQTYKAIKEGRETKGNY